jgi:hypothetical protein
VSDLPKMVPSARDRVVQVAGCFKLPGYPQEVCRAADSVSLVNDAFRDGVLAERAAGGDAMRLIQEAAKLLPGHDDAMRKDERERILALLREPSAELVEAAACMIDRHEDSVGTAARAVLAAIAAKIGGNP